MNSADKANSPPRPVRLENILRPDWREVVQARMKELDTNVPAVAELIGTHRSTLYNNLNKVTSFPRLDTFLLLILALDIPLERVVHTRPVDEDSEEWWTLIAQLQRGSVEREISLESLKSAVETARRRRHND